jgi:late competence protein required for DNA uptake (superfamily II DNA/RNA helicase)
MKIDSHKIICDFCGEKHPFKDLKQVPLRIDKTSRVQYLFAFICQNCIVVGKRKTTENQQIRSFTGRSRDKNEQSVFDSEEDGDA